MDELLERSEEGMWLRRLKLKASSAAPWRSSIGKQRAEEASVTPTRQGTLRWVCTPNAAHWPCFLGTLQVLKAAH